MALSITQLRRILRAALLTPTDYGWGLPVLCWGAPGSAKTSVWRQVARELGLPAVWLSPGARGEGAFGCVPVPSADGSRLTYPAADWAADMVTRGYGLTLVDELTSCPPALQPPLMGLLLDRIIGSAQLSYGCRVVAAANPVDQAAAGYDLPAPLANRVVHLAWSDPTLDEWLEHEAGHGQRVADRLSGRAAAHEAEDLLEAATRRQAEEARLLDEHPMYWATAFGTVAGYHRSLGGARLRDQPAVDDPRSGGAWGSPRSWETATAAWATAEAHRLTEPERDALVAGCVGEGDASQLAAWADGARLPDVGELLEGRLAWTPDPAHADRTIATVSGLAARLGSAPDRRTRDRWVARVFELVAPLTDTAPDLARVAVRAASRAGGTVDTSPAAKAMLHRLGSLGMDQAV